MAEKGTPRRPRGYEGIHHETIGSDILAVLRSLHFPISILGKEKVAALEKLDPNHWYPIGDLLSLLELLDGKIGQLGLRKMGRTLFRDSHAERVRQSVRSASDILYNFNAMYNHANRGQKIGGWQVVSFAPGRAEFEKTTPHHCVMEEGILLEALSTVGVLAEITQTKCFRRGDEACRFIITSTVTGERWAPPGGPASKK